MTKEEFLNAYGDFELIKSQAVESAFNLMGVLQEENVYEVRQAVLMLRVLAEFCDYLNIAPSPVTTQEEDMP